MLKVFVLLLNFLFVVYLMFLYNILVCKLTTCLYFSMLFLILWHYVILCILLHFYFLLYVLLFFFIYNSNRTN